MIIPKRILLRIEAGEVSVAFRRWKRPTVRSGGRLRTSIGELAIDAVAIVSLDEISDADVRASGFTDRSELEKYLAGIGGDGEIYRIAVSYRGVDPRLERRRRESLSDSEFDEIRKRLDRLDRASSTGPWTHQYLDLILKRPDTLALELAQSIGMERDPFKANVRKLKELGLTESRRPGYRISPCGNAYLERRREADG